MTISDHDRTGTSVLIVVALVVLVVGIGTVTGVTPPPPNPLADGSPAIVAQNGSMNHTAGLAVVEGYKEAPRLQIQLRDRDEALTIVLQDGNGTVIDTEQYIGPETDTVEVAFIPEGQTETFWEPENPYTLRMRSIGSKDMETVELRIPYAAK